MLALLLASVSAFAQMFGGTWTCHDGSYTVPWRIAPAAAPTWTTVSYGSPNLGGIAYVGYLPAAHSWIYDDFHSDGSYSRNLSPGPSGSTWVWTGSYFTATQIRQGSVTWRLTSSRRIDRIFAPLQNGKYVTSGGDYCTK